MQHNKGLVTYIYLIAIGSDLTYMFCHLSLAPRLRNFFHAQLS